MIKFKDINRSKMAEQKTEEELEYGECYRLNSSKLVEILTEIEEFEGETMMKGDGIYIYGEGGKRTSGYIGRIIDGSVINKSNSLYLQIRNIHEHYNKKKWKASYIDTNLVNILRQFIV